MPPRGESTAPAATRQRWPVGRLVAVVVLALYAPLVSAPALTRDDTEHIFANPYDLNGTWPALWREPYFGPYIPVMSTVWALLHTLGGIGGASRPAVR